jgi:hypothetical protein
MLSSLLIKIIHNKLTGGRSQYISITQMSELLGHFPVNCCPRKVYNKGVRYREKLPPIWEMLMTNHEVIHIAVAPPANLDANLVRSVATVINKSPSQTHLLLAGEVPKVIAHYDSIQVAESIIQNLRNLGLVAIACRDSELRQFPQTFKAQTLEFREKEVLFRDSAGREKSIAENNVFLVLVGRIEPSVEVETTKQKTKFSLPRTLLMGGIPTWRRVDEKTTTHSIQAECFARLYERKSPDPSVDILQHHMNYSFLGTKIAASSFTNFGTFVLGLRKVLPQAIFDNRLAKPSVLTTSSSRVWEDIEINCKLIYLFHVVTSGLDSCT